jgi:hypothetical protein
LEVSNIDQRAMMPSRHTAAITAPFRSSVTERSEALPLDLARGIYARSSNAHFIASLRCTECRLIHEAQVNADPMKSDAIGW